MCTSITVQALVLSSFAYTRIKFLSFSLFNISICLTIELLFYSLLYTNEDVRAIR